MSEEVKEEKKPEKKKGLFAKAKDALLPDQEEQAAIIVLLYVWVFLCGPVEY